MNSRRACFILLTLLLLCAPSAHGQPAEPGPTADTAEAPDDGQKEKKARTHFEAGIKLFDEKDWGGALAEFLRSRELFPTRVASRNAAVCLSRLRRYDEALDLFEAMLAEYPDMSEKDKGFIRRQMAELSARVGYVDVVTAEGGATITIGGRKRGDSPLDAPVRVPVGSHLVQVSKTGYAPFETRVEVAAAQTAKVTARLEALTQSGRLRITEQTGQTLTVLVDNVAVGKTPWEGMVEPGDHTVVLEGEGDVGTQPASAHVRINQLTKLNLVAEPLRCQLRVEPTPVGATVSVDAVAVGRGVWEGRLRCGDHVVEVGQEGFLPFTKKLSLPEGKQDSIVAQLERDPRSPLWGAAKPSRFVLDVHLGAALAPSFGGELPEACKDGCSKSLPFGLVAVIRPGYRFGSGLGFSLSVGALLLNHDVTERRAVLRDQPDQLNSNTGFVDDELRLRGILAGADAFYQGGESWVWSARLGGGVLLGTLHDTRSGTFFNDPAGAEAGGTYDMQPAKESPDARFVYISPEFRFGHKLGKRFEITAGLKMLVLVSLDQPQWSDKKDVISPALGLGIFGEQTLVGKTLWVLSPGVGAGYAF